MFWPEPVIKYVCRRGSYAAEPKCAGWPTSLCASKTPMGLWAPATALNKATLSARESMLVDVWNETPPGSHQLSVRLSDSRQKRSLLDGDPVAVEGKRCQ